MQRLISATALAALALASFFGGCETVATNTSHTFDTVVVDAGHGGKDSGAFRRYSPPEKAVALDVALRVDRKLRESQLRTVLTRSNDTFIPLDSRVAIGNERKKFDLRQHPFQRLAPARRGGSRNLLSFALCLRSGRSD